MAKIHQLHTRSQGAAQLRQWVEEFKFPSPPESRAEFAFRIPAASHICCR
jgi:hypothetical protein